jgi:opacity protein-like surface antigen
MMKNLFSTFILILITTTAFCQEPVQQGVHFGLKASPSLAWLRSDTKGYDSDGSRVGFIYGLITEFNFASRYAFATGIDIAYRGGKFKTVQEKTDTTTSITSTYNLQYLEIPITLKLKTNEIGSVTYYMQIGLAPGFNIRARQSYDGTMQVKDPAGVIHNTPVSDEKIDIMDDINSLNVSMILGAGLEYTLSGNTVLLGGIQFSNGFTDVFDNDAKVNSNYLALTLGVLF